MEDTKEAIDVNEEHKVEESNENQKEFIEETIEVLLKTQLQPNGDITYLAITQGDKELNLTVAQAKSLTALLQVKLKLTKDPKASIEEKDKHLIHRDY